jgi:hypothetical protein
MLALPPAGEEEPEAELTLVQFRLLSSSLNDAFPLRCLKLSLR